VTTSRKNLPSTRKKTAFTQTHDCLYQLIAWLAGVRRDASPTLAAAEEAFDAIWKNHGPVEHPYAADYRRLTTRLIRALICAGAGRKFRDKEPIAIDLPGGRVVIEPDEIVELPDGAVIIRRINTGQKRSDEYDRLDYILYHLVGQARFGVRYRVEAVHLSDESVEVVELTSKKIESRKEKSNIMIGSILGGNFPVEVDSVTCPRCPHFFICSAVPPGRLSLL
jgi:hypothetical protein